MNTKVKKGFTLIELLIVIAIIGVLAVAFLPTLLGAPAKARDSQRISSIQTIQAFLVDRSLTVGSLPDGTCILPDSGDDISNIIAANLPSFGGTFPRDPRSENGPPGCEGGFGYLKDPGVGYSAAVYAYLETEENSNYDCSDVDAWGSEYTELELGEYSPDNEGVPCFVALVQ